MEACVCKDSKFIVRWSVISEEKSFNNQLLIRHYDSQLEEAADKAFLV